MTTPISKKKTTTGKKVFDLYGVNFIVDSQLHWWWMKLQPWKFTEIAKGVMLRK
jgi:hypothetical protein